jgi:hypothetical protein
MSTEKGKLLMVGSVNNEKPTLGARAGGVM